MFYIFFFLMIEVKFVLLWVNCDYWEFNWFIMLVIKEFKFIGNLILFWGNRLKRCEWNDWWVLGSLKIIILLLGLYK